jgi:hypothetical protein
MSALVQSVTIGNLLVNSQSITSGTRATRVMEVVWFILLHISKIIILVNGEKRKCFRGTAHNLPGPPTLRERAPYSTKLSEISPRRRIANLKSCFLLRSCQNISITFRLSVVQKGGHIGNYKGMASLRLAAIKRKA